jgi:ribonuclease P/MRP protein subunit POP5
MMTVKYLSPATSTVIIQCPRSAFRLVWAALTYSSLLPPPSAEPLSGRRSWGSSNLTRSVSHGAGVFRVLRVSGTMRKAEEEAVRRARKEISLVKKAVNLGLGLDHGCGISPAGVHGRQDAASLDVISNEDGVGEKLEGEGNEGGMRGFD